MSRHPKPVQIVLQARDYALLRGFLDSRLMTLKHAALLFYGGSFEAAKKRMQKLRGAGLITARPRRPQDPAIYMLGHEGFLRLRQEGMLNPAHDAAWARFQKRRRIGDLMLGHELALLDVKAAFTSALNSLTGFTLKEFSLDADRHKFRVVTAAAGSGTQVRFQSSFAKPDGFIRIMTKETGADHFLFLEVDRGTESLGRLVQKARHYHQHYTGGGFAKRFDHKREDFRKAPFRVLFIFKTAERRDNVGRKLLSSRVPIKNQAWLTTMDEVIRGPLGAIWVRPGDYRSSLDTRDLTQLPLF